jgi:hypothetical protein
VRSNVDKSTEISKAGMSKLGRLSDEIYIYINLLHRVPGDILCEKFN